MSIATAPRPIPLALARECLASLLERRQRASLALLGIVIGTASVVTMLTLGHIAQLETLRLFRDMGVDLLQVQAIPAGPAPTALDAAAIARLPDRHASIRMAVALTVGNGEASHGGKRTHVGIAAAPPVLRPLAGLHLAHGRFLASSDNDTTAIVLGADAAAALSSDRRPLRVGSMVRLNRYVFTVVGILRTTPYTPLHPTDFNNAALVPPASARRLLNRPAPSTALIAMRPNTDADTLGQRLVIELARPGATLHALSARQLVDAMNAEKAVHTRLLTAIGAISLAVGGIGVMNVMLMSVLERRREIGLRAAIGATPADIQMLFLVEAALLSMAGGAFGLFSGLTVAYIVARGSGWIFDLPFHVVPLGIGLATGVGIISGLLPARQAARLDPIEALRAE
ncbi:ABC transporter permease [Parapedomonas caeni]